MSSMILGSSSQIETESMSQGKGQTTLFMYRHFRTKKTWMERAVYVVYHRINRVSSSSSQFASTQRWLESIVRLDTVATIVKVLHCFSIRDLELSIFSIEPIESSSTGSIGSVSIIRGRWCAVLVATPQLPRLIHSLWNLFSGCSARRSRTHWSSACRSRTCRSSRRSPRQLNQLNSIDGTSSIELQIICTMCLVREMIIIKNI